jgi:hypothetical protein
MRQGLRSVLDAYADIRRVGEAQEWSQNDQTARGAPSSGGSDGQQHADDECIEATEHITCPYLDTIVSGISVNSGDDKRVAMERLRS